MPELNINEAMSLFTQSSTFDLKSKGNKQIIELCVERCRFRKGSGGDSYDQDNQVNPNQVSTYQYHPLALDVLGTQLRDIDQEGCEAQLKKINTVDIFNQSRENNHPIFSIARKSFDTLAVEDQLLFMDVALFSPENLYEGCNLFEWLGMVHGIASTHEVMTRLEMLKRKSLLERLGDGIKTRIGMHDLWCAFCVVAETENGELGRRCWVLYDTKKRSELLETTPLFGIWENVKRMAFFDFHSQLRTLERANFSHFVNITVLTLWGLTSSEELSRQHSKQHVLDLSGLVHLRSLEVSGEFSAFQPRFSLQGLQRGLTFLSLTNLDPHIPGTGLGSRQQLIELIGCLEELQYLQLIDFGDSKLPDMTSMIAIQVSTFLGCHHTKPLNTSVPLTTLRRISPILQWLENSARSGALSRPYSP